MYGDIFAIGGETSPPFVYISHPEGIKQVLTAEPEKFIVGKGNRILRFLLGDNSLILMDGNAHQSKRQLMMPSFHGEHLRSYSQTIWDITRQVTDKWKLGKAFSYPPNYSRNNLTSHLKSSIWNLRRRARTKTSPTDYRSLRYF